MLNSQNYNNVNDINTLQACIYLRIKHREAQGAFETNHNLKCIQDTFSLDVCIMKFTYICRFQLLEYRQSNQNR